MALVEQGFGALRGIHWPVVFADIIARGRSPQDVEVFIWKPLCDICWERLAGNHHQISAAGDQRRNRAGAVQGDGTQISHHDSRPTAGRLLIDLFSADDLRRRPAPRLGDPPGLKVQIHGVSLPELPVPNLRDWERLPRASQRRRHRRHGSPLSRRT